MFPVKLQRKADIMTLSRRKVLAAVSTDGRVKQRLSVQAADVREPAWAPFNR